MSDIADPFALEKGLRVVVTAGASGIGRAIADLLIARGARVLVCDVADEYSPIFAPPTRTPARPRPTSPRRPTSIACSPQAQSSLGGLDALVNNAGIAGPTGGVEAIDPADWRRTIDVCLTGQFLCARRATPMLKANGGGAIVNMSSSAGRFGYAFRTPYSAAKWGVIGFTQSLAKELGPSGIRVNAILPGIVEGPRMSKVIADRAKQTGVDYAAMEKTYLDRVSLRRMVTANDVAATVAYLLSPAGRNMSGQSIGVDGNVETL